MSQKQIAHKFLFLNFVAALCNLDLRLTQVRPPLY